MANARKYDLEIYVLSKKYHIPVMTLAKIAELLLPTATLVALQYKANSGPSLCSSAAKPSDNDRPEDSVYPRPPGTLDSTERSEPYQPQSPGDDASEARC
jgi:hypothetical protein